MGNQMVDASANHNLASLPTKLKFLLLARLFKHYRHYSICKWQTKSGGEWKLHFGYHKSLRRKSAISSMDALESCNRKTSNDLWADNWTLIISGAFRNAHSIRPSASSEMINTKPE